MPTPTGAPGAGPDLPDAPEKLMVAYAETCGSSSVVVRPGIKPFVDPGVGTALEAESMNGPWGVSCVTQFEPAFTSMAIRFSAMVALVRLVTRKVVPIGRGEPTRPGRNGRNPQFAGS